MALSGIFSTNRNTGAGAEYPSHVYVTWSATQNIENNTSLITWYCYGGSDASNYSKYTYTGPVSLTIDGQNVLYISDRFAMKKDKLIGSGSLTVNHNADGTKKVSIGMYAYVYVHPGYGYDPCSYSGEITLDTIPRASSLTLSSSSVNVGGSITANITRASTNFTHDVEFYINSTYYQKYTNVATSQSFTIPNSWYNAMPSSTSCTSYCRITTYNGSTKIGDQVIKSFSVNVPTSVVPKIGSITLTPDLINNRSILVKGKNRLTISTSNCTAGDGSSITSYTFSGPSLNTTVSSSSSSSSTSISSVTNIGLLTYTVTITDTRGRSSSKSASITCYDYYVPYFNIFNAYRSNRDGTPNVNGGYLYCEYSHAYASVNNTNSVNIKIYYNGTETTNTLINLNGDTDTTYKVYLIIEDAYGGRNQSNIITVFGQSRILNITSDGTGVAIGKMAESSNLFECRWPAKFDENITLLKPLSIENGGTGANNVSSALANIGAAPISHNHSASQITSGSLPVTRGGTGGTNAIDALKNLGLTATSTELNYNSGVTSNIQQQLNNKISFTVLWENAKPTDTFVGQTINVNWSGYELLIIQSTRGSATMIPYIGAYTQLHYTESDSSVQYTLWATDRWIKIEGETSISISDGNTRGSFGTLTQNDRIIPWKIYGVKGIIPLL